MHEGIENPHNLSKNAEVGERPPIGVLMDIQIALIRRDGADDDERALRWIDQNAEGFSDYLRDHPEISTAWEEATPEERERILDELETAEEDGFPRTTRETE